MYEGVIVQNCILHYLNFILVTGNLRKLAKLTAEISNKVNDNPFAESLLDELSNQFRHRHRVSPSVCVQSANYHCTE